MRRLRNLFAAQVVIDDGSGDDKVMETVNGSCNPYGLLLWRPR